MKEEFDNPFPYRLPIQKVMERKHGSKKSQGTRRSA
jgi:hypothetical protein